MSAEYNKKRVSIGSEVPGAVIAGRASVSHPKNCSHECVYGKGRDFCFPCYKKIMDEMREKRAERAERG